MNGCPELTCVGLLFFGEIVLCLQFLETSSDMSGNVCCFSRRLLGLRIKECRISHALSINDLAGVMLITPEIVEQYESGKVRVPLRHLLLLQRYISLDLESVLLSGIGDINSGQSQGLGAEFSPVEFEVEDYSSAVIFYAKSRNDFMRAYLIESINQARSARAR